MTVDRPDYSSEIVKPGKYAGKSLAIFTSGGDSQGMNAAVRAVVRFGIYLGCRVYFIKEGYQGMIDGGECIVEAKWGSVSGIIHKGGTVIGSARSTEFRERPGRLKAAYNLVSRNICNLIVIGGDGSLTGANQFRKDWSSLLDELEETGKINQEARIRNAHLNIVGMVGSIDNDFCGTDMTIGTDSALHRIVEAVDAIRPTADSHQRTFIMEVMGRHCGYLALVAGIVTEADYIFIPEWPPKRDWPERLCKKLQTGRDESQQRLNTIIVAEGAVDRDGNPITCDQIKDIVVKNLKQDTRITVLGHVQRGGAPSAFDRVLGCRMGAESVMALMDSNPTTEPCVISLKGNTAVRLPLMKCVEDTQEIAKVMAEGQYERAVELRGKSFQRNLDTFRLLSRTSADAVDGQSKAVFNMAVMHIGAPCCGMNAAVRSFVRNVLSFNHNVFGIHNGIEGLAEGNIEQMTWKNVTGWVSCGGAFLGTKRTLPKEKKDLMPAIIENLKLFNIHGLLIIGGFEAFNASLQFAEAKKAGVEGLKIPIVVVPATISNNVPGSAFSLGADTALNEISEICDRIRQSAQGTKRRVFIVETMGGFCGYLATMAGVAGGADAAYINEEPFSIRTIMQDIDILKSKMDSGRIERGLILRNEKANDNYSTDFISRLFAEDGKSHFSVRTNVLGHMQQGGKPTPFDRNMATKMAAKACTWLIDCIERNCHVVNGEGEGEGKRTHVKVFADSNDTTCLLGLKHFHYEFHPVMDLIEETDFEKRRWKHVWWMNQRAIMNILAQHDSTYVVEAHEEI